MGRQGRQRTPRRRTTPVEGVDTGVGRARVHDVGRSQRRLVIDEEIHGEVDLEDPTHLSLDYQSRLNRILVALNPPQGGRVMHLGGGAFAIPRALSVERPDLTHTVVERSAAIIRLAEQHLGLARSQQVVVRKGDGRTAVERLPDSSIDVIVCDAFVDLAVPPHMITAEFMTQVRRVLRPSGYYVINIVDEQPWSRLGSAAAAARTAFDAVAAVGARGVARLVDPGNVFLIATSGAVPTRRLLHEGAVHVHPFAFVPAARLSGLATTNRARRDDD